MTYALRTVALFVAIAASAVSGCGHRPPRAATSPASSASAPGPHVLDGTYTFVADGTRMTVNGQPRAGGLASTTTWRITACGAGCAAVTSSLGWTTEMHLIRNAWTATRTLDVNCPAGPATMTYSLDADTLTGSATNTIPCAGAPTVAVVPARLTKN